VDPAYDGDRQVRDGAWVAELTGLLDLASWPKGMRVIVRKERPQPRRATAVHRYRRAPVHLLRHLGPDRAARLLAEIGDARGRFPPATP
jgi:hypothetical protein